MSEGRPLAGLLLALSVGCRGAGDSGAIDDAPALQIDLDEDGTPSPRDCDDGDNSTSPAAPELCFDAVDNDCDGLIDSDDPDCAQSASAKTGPSSASRSANSE